MWKLKFYADKPPKYTNKYFCFQGSEIRLEVLIYLFVHRGNKIRSLFIENVKTNENIRVTPIEIDEIYQKIDGIVKSIESGKIAYSPFYVTLQQVISDIRQPKHQ